MKDKFKLLFIIPTMETGGAQKVLSVLLRNLSREKFDITLGVLTDTGVFYDTVPENVKKVNLKTSRVRYSAPGIYKLIRRSRPDLVFVFDVNHLNLIVGILSFFLPSRIKYITREAVVLSSFINTYTFFKSLRKALYKLTFRRFNLIICQSNYMKEHLIRHFKVAPESVTVINNPVEISQLQHASLSNERLLPENSFNLIAVARIVYVKGYDLLIKALSLVKTPNVHLTILGEKTPESPGYREHIDRLVTENGLSNKISFLGFQSNPYKYVKQSDLLIITSRTEAFSNVAIESNALGIPVLAFNSPGGMAEIIADNFNGWLVENGNIQALAEAIDDRAHQQLSTADIVKYTWEKYDVSKIVPLYDKAILYLMMSSV
jgi:glycosyltransferase involved in cell wall biosynthesis